MKYDAILLVSFGGPEGPDEVMPFLENVLRGRNVPPKRMHEVAEHYQHFGGVSPINAQNRALIAALEKELAEHGLNLPVYFGNRNWHPLLDDTLAQMKRDGVQRAIALVTSAFSSYSGCRQYRENIEQAREALQPDAPVVDKLRVFYNHPLFVASIVDNLRATLADWEEQQRPSIPLAFTAHSIPAGMAENCQYQSQLLESCRLVVQEVGNNPWTLVYQSRSGPPHQKWLEPDICEFIRREHRRGMTDLVVVPIGFLSDHMEVKFDLDTEAKALCDSLEIRMQRAPTVGTDRRFAAMIRELVEERMTESPNRRYLGTHGPSHDVCPDSCCLPGIGPAVK